MVSFTAMLGLQGGTAQANRQSRTVVQIFSQRTDHTVSFREGSRMLSHGIYLVLSLLSGSPWKAMNYSYQALKNLCLALALKPSSLWLKMASNDPCFLVIVPICNSLPLTIAEVMERYFQDQVIKIQWLPFWANSLILSDSLLYGKQTAVF